jgi:hypothetical protein
MATKRAFGVINQKLQSIRKKKNVANEKKQTEQDVAKEVGEPDQEVEEGQATQEPATNDPTLSRRKHFTYLTLLLIAALTINRNHPSLGNIHAPVRKLSKEQGLIDAALALLVRDVEVLAGIQLTGYPQSHPKILLSASPGRVLFATVANPRLHSKSAQQNLKEVEFRNLGNDLWPMIYRVGKGGKHFEVIMQILKPKYVLSYVIIYRSHS